MVPAGPPVVVAVVVVVVVLALLLALPRQLPMKSRRLWPICKRPAIPDSTPDVIKSKLDTLRQARAKAVAHLTAAQADLKTALTQRQEAVLVVNGLLN